jgi:ABC-type transporter Mla maintaining outer membrane lipid asymmetry ATPase subunit MlaF
MTDKKTTEFTTDNVLKINDLCKSFGENQVLDEFNLELNF